MSAHILDTADPAALTRALPDSQWLVACLCAAWCDVCTAYRPAFDALAARHPDKCFVWIDVEDHADLVGDFDVENFPTLLMQRGDIVAFYGTTLPDAHVADRIVSNLALKSDAELAAEAGSSAERREWQHDANLRRAISRAHGDPDED